jgi:hypothetical protein
VIVYGAGHFKIRVRIRLLHHLAGPRPNLAIDRDQPIRFQVLRQLLRVLIPRQRRPAKQPRLNVLFTRGIEAHRNRECAVLWIVDAYMRHGVPVRRRGDPVPVRGVDPENLDLLVVVIVRHRNPESTCLAPGVISFTVALYSK